MKGKQKSPSTKQRKMLHVSHNLGLEAPPKALKKILHKISSTYKHKKAVQVALRYCTNWAALLKTKKQYI